jgi:transcriptional regulator with XRE-family HTH domain
MDLRSVLANELVRRRQLNHRYSLRAYARALGTHHSTLSRILDGRRRLTMRTIHRLAGRLSLSPAQRAEACITENAATILRLVGQPRFRPNVRWVAVTAGIPIDQVNIALHRLLSERRLVMASPGHWIARSP